MKPGICQSCGSGELVGRFGADDGPGVVVCRSCAQAMRLWVSLEISVVPGWVCSECQGFNGEAKERLEQCRACGTPRGGAR